MAKNIFEETEFFINGHVDGPSRVLLEYMNDLNNNPPDDWIGFRALVEK